MASADLIKGEISRHYAQALESPSCRGGGDCCDEPGEAAIYPLEIMGRIPEGAVSFGCDNPVALASLRPGETVLDLGSGGGKICYILSKVVGKKGRVIGVDFNDKMLTLARKYQNEMAQKYGFANVKFVKGKIQDLSLELDKVQAWLQEHPIGG